MALLAAAVLTIGAVVQLHRLWVQLPGPSMARIDWYAVRQVRTKFTGDAFEGLLLAALSDYVTEGVHYPARLPQMLDETRAAAGRLRHTQLARLQLATLGMLQLEHEGLPADQCWPKLQGHLAGLDAAQFPHFMAELLDAEAGIYIRLGLPIGNAQQIALRNLGYAHGPFLQLFVARMRRIADERRQAGDPATADYCTRLTARLLREWLLLPGPVGLRLLAAELLADELDHRDLATILGSTGGIAEKCRAWRTAYRTAAASLPPPGPMMLRVGDEPVAVSTKPLRRFLSLIVLLGPATAAASAVALASAALWPVPRARRSSAIARAGPAVLAVGIAGSLGWVLLAGLPATVFEESFRLQVQDLDSAPTARLGAATGIVISVAIAAMWGWWRCAACSRRVAFAGAASITWLFASALFLAVTLAAGAAVSGYNARMAAPFDEQLAALAPPNAAGLLDDLRAWNP